MGKRIRIRRKELHKTQEILSEEIGISTSFLGHIERGSRKASIETLVKLANALHCSLDQFLVDSLSEETPPCVRTEAEKKLVSDILELFRTYRNN